MNTIIGLTIIYTLINIFCWFVLGGCDFTFKENIVHSLFTELLIVLLLIGCYFITGGN